MNPKIFQFVFVVIGPLPGYTAMAFWKIKSFSVAMATDHMAWTKFIWLFEDNSRNISVKRFSNICSLSKYLQFVKIFAVSQNICSLSKYLQ